MKNYFKSTIAIIFVSSLGLTSCFDLAPGATDAEASLKETMAQSLTTELSGSCDFDSRKTESMLQEEPGIIITMNNPSNPENVVYLIQHPDNSMRYVACNMPDALKVEGMKVVFDAEKKMVDPTERWYAHPIKLTRIHSTTGGLVSNN